MGVFFAQGKIMIEKLLLSCQAEMLNSNWFPHVEPELRSLALAYTLGGL